MKYYLISTDNLDQIQFIPHPKRDVNVKGKIIELTEEEILIITNIGEISGPSKEVEAYCEARKKIRKVLE